MRKGRVLYGRQNESLESKIRYMLSLSLEERYSSGLAKGYLRRILERNQERLYGRDKHRRIQILKQIQS